MSLDPVVLFFLLGLVARLSRSDLRLPEPLYEALSIYLLLAIGLKGGAELARQPLLGIAPLALTGIALSALLPLLAYPVLRRLGRFAQADAASIAAHYGSVSVVTFAVAQSFLTRRGLEPEPQMSVLVALMEAPGLIVGILLARRESLHTVSWRHLAHETLFGKAVFLLLGGLLIGALIGPQGLAPMKPLFGKAATSAPKAASFSWTLAPCVTAMVKETITSAAARYTPSTPGFNSSSTGVFMPKRNNMQGRAKKSTKPFKPGIAASASRPRHAAR